MSLWRSLTAVVGAALVLALAPAGSAEARSGIGGTRSVVTASWVEEWDPAAQRWVRVAESPAAIRAEAATISQTTTAAHAGVVVTETILAPDAPSFAIPRQNFYRPGAGPVLAQYGPFRVLDDKRAALVAATDVASPRHFDAMLRDYPGLAVLEMPDAPGTSHDLANLALGRKIRAAGLATHVPEGGSVRSGAVELFLAGTRHTMARGATFAVHSWLDTRGREPRHFAEDAPENRLYLDYYEEMGMAPDHARAFYAMTNSVPHSGALWLDRAAMERWIAPLEARLAPPEEAEPELAPIRTLAALKDTESMAIPAVNALMAEGDAPGEVEAVSEAVPEAVSETGAETLPAPVLTPVLVWFETPVITLASLSARLDSGAVFP